MRPGGPSRRRIIVLALAVVAAGVSALTLLRNADENRAVEPIAAAYPEGPLSHHGRLYFAEMGADRVSVVDDGTARPFFKQRGCGPTAIAPYGVDGYVVLCHIGRRVVAVDADGEERRRWDTDTEGKSLFGPNDASADGRGGVYLSDPGVFSRESEPDGRLLYLAGDGVVRVVADTLWYPNGVHVDRRHQHLYVSEHMSGEVLRFKIASDGSLEQRRTIARLTEAEASQRYETTYDEAGPDGLEIGPNGDLYVVVYGEGRVVRFDRTGAYLGAIELPTRYATNIAFSPDGSAATTGAFRNDTPPFAGEVRFHTPEAAAGELHDR